MRTGLTEGAAAAVCLDFDLAAAHFGRWADQRARETREEPLSATEKKKQVKHVPKYQSLDQMLGIAPTNGPDRPVKQRQEATKAVDRKADELRRDPAALAEFLRLNRDA